MEIKCPECDGTGEIPEGVHCSLCSGSGYTDLHDAIVVLFNCKNLLQLRTDSLITETDRAHERIDEWEKGDK